MPPKKAAKQQEEASEKVAEGDDERILTITISGRLTQKPLPPQSVGQAPTATALPAVPTTKQTNTPRSARTQASEAPSSSHQADSVAVLAQPYFCLTAPSVSASAPQPPPAEKGAPQPPPTFAPGGFETIRSEPMTASTSDFAVPIFQRKLVLTPQTVPTLLGEDFTLKVMSVSEARAEAAAAAALGPGGKGKGGGAAGKKGGKGGDAAGAAQQQQRGGGGGDGASTARSDGGDHSGDIEHFGFSFGLSNILSGASRDTIVITHDNIEEFCQKIVQQEEEKAAKEKAAAIQQQQQQQQQQAEAAGAAAAAAASPPSTKQAKGGAQAQPPATTQQQQPASLSATANLNTSTGHPSLNNTVANALAPTSPAPLNNTLASTKKANKKLVPLLHALLGYDELVVDIQASSPLLTPANIDKYQPVVVEVTRACDLPPIRTLHIGKDHPSNASLLPQGTVQLRKTDMGGMRDCYKGVHVQYKFLGRTVQTPERAHDTDVEWNHRKVFFLFEHSPLRVYQTLFFDPIEFELRDREAKNAASPTAVAFSGIASVSMREALERREKRFVAATQVVPKRVGAEGKASDYLSFGTSLVTKVHFFKAMPMLDFVYPQVAIPSLSGDAADAAATTAAAVPAPPAGKAGGKTGKASIVPSTAASAATPSVPPTAQSQASKATPTPSQRQHQHRDAEKGGLGATSPGGGGVAEEQRPFLSRCLIVLPYKEEKVTHPIIQTIMGTLVAFQAGNSADADVTEYQRPPTPPPENAQQQQQQQQQGAGKKGGAVDKGGKAGAKDKKGAAADAAAAAQQQQQQEPAQPKKPSGPVNEYGIPLLQVHCADAVSGFEIMDDQYRIIVVEGHMHAVQKIVGLATSVAGGKQNVQIYFNRSLMFPKRIYHSYPPLVLPLVHPDEAKAAAAAADAALNGDETTSVGAGRSPGADGKSGAAGKGKGGGTSPTTQGGAGAAAGGAKGGQAKTSGGGKGGPEVPPLQATVASTADATPSSGLAASSAGGGTGATHDELDAGGVGGRIRRIRLAHIITGLKLKQAHYLHRSLSVDCLRCIEKLNALISPDVCRSMVVALDRDYFPTPAEIIALERVFGTTLETYDVCASSKFQSFSNTCVSDVVADSVKAQEEAAHRAKYGERSAGVIDFDSLRKCVGKVYSFVAVPATPGQTTGLPSLKRLLHRYPNRAYMYATEHNKVVACAFSAPPPTQLLRFRMTAQVLSGKPPVSLKQQQQQQQNALLNAAIPELRDNNDDERAGGGGEGQDPEPIVYVMSFESMAVKSTENQNKSYMQWKRKQAAKAPPSLCRYIRDQRAQKHKETHKRDTDAGGDSSGEDSDEGFIDPPPELEDDLGPGYQGEIEAEKNYLEESRFAYTDVKGARTTQAPPDYSYGEAMLKKLVAKEDRHRQRVEYIPRDRPRFHTHNVRAAADDRKPSNSLSESRVEDLKAPWKPQTEYRGIKDGRQITVGGATTMGSVVDMTSIFAEKAVDKWKQDLEDINKVKRDWESKVVVDDTRFMVSNRIPKDKSDGIRKFQNILEDEPKKLSIKKGYIQPPPTSIATAPEQKMMEFVAPGQTKHPEQKSFYYAKKLLKAIPKIPPMPEDDKQGPLWYERPSFKQQSGSSE